MQSRVAIMQPRAVIMQRRLKKLVPFLMELLQKWAIWLQETRPALYIRLFLSWNLKVLKQFCLKRRLKTRARPILLCFLFLQCGPQRPWMASTSKSPMPMVTIRSLQRYRIQARFSVLQAMTHPWKYIPLSLNRYSS